MLSCHQHMLYHCLVQLLPCAPADPTTGNPAEAFLATATALQQLHPYSSNLVSTIYAATAAPKKLPQHTGG